MSRSFGRRGKGVHDLIKNDPHHGAKKGKNEYEGGYTSLVKALKNRPVRTLKPRPSLNEGMSRISGNLRNLPRKYCKELLAFSEDNPTLINLLSSRLVNFEVPRPNSAIFRYDQTITVTGNSSYVVKGYSDPPYSTYRSNRISWSRVGRESEDGRPSLSVKHNLNTKKMRSIMEARSNFLVDSVIRIEDAVERDAVPFYLTRDMRLIQKVAVVANVAISLTSDHDTNLTPSLMEMHEEAVDDSMLKNLGEGRVVQTNGYENNGLIIPNNGSSKIGSTVSHLLRSGVFATADPNPKGDIQVLQKVLEGSSRERDLTDTNVVVTDPVATLYSCLSYPYVVNASLDPNYIFWGGFQAPYPESSVRGSRLRISSEEGSALSCKRVRLNSSERYRPVASKGSPILDYFKMTNVFKEVDSLCKDVSQAYEKYLESYLPIHSTLLTENQLPGHARYSYMLGADWGFDGFADNVRDSYLSRFLNRRNNFLLGQWFKSSKSSLADSMVRESSFVRREGISLVRREEIPKPCNYHGDDISPVLSAANKRFRKRLPPNNREEVSYQRNPVVTPSSFFTYVGVSRKANYLQSILSLIQNLIHKAVSRLPLVNLSVQLHFEEKAGEDGIYLKVKMGGDTYFGISPSLVPYNLQHKFMGYMKHLDENGLYHGQNKSNMCFTEGDCGRPGDIISVYGGGFTRETSSFIGRSTGNSTPEDLLLKSFNPKEFARDILDLVQEIAHTDIKRKAYEFFDTKGEFILGITGKEEVIEKGRAAFNSMVDAQLTGCYTMEGPNSSVEFFEKYENEIYNIARSIRDLQEMHGIYEMVNRISNENRVALPKVASKTHDTELVYRSNHYYVWDETTQKFEGYQVSLKEMNSCFRIVNMPPVIGDGVVCSSGGDMFIVTRDDMARSRVMKRNKVTIEQANEAFGHVSNSESLNDRRDSDSGGQNSPNEFGFSEPVGDSELSEVDQYCEEQIFSLYNS